MPKIRIETLEDDLDLPDETYDWLATLERTKQHNSSYRTVEDKRGRKKVTRKRGKVGLFQEDADL